MQSIRYIHLLVFFSIYGTCYGQAYTIETDRPDQSDGVSTVPRYMFQVEDGATFERATAINNFMLRFGLTKTTEIRLLADAGRSDYTNGLQPITLSVKQQIVQQKNALPAITFVGYVGFPTLATKNLRPESIPFELKLAFENELTDQVSIGYNIGTSDNFHQMNVTFGVGFAASKNTSLFAEYFSSIQVGMIEHNLDAGLLYLVFPCFQLDFAIGHGIDNSAPRFFGTFGISYLFINNKAKKMR